MGVLFILIIWPFPRSFCNYQYCCWQSELHRQEAGLQHVHYVKYPWHSAATLCSKNITLLILRSNFSVGWSILQNSARLCLRLFTYCMETLRLGTILHAAAMLCTKEGGSTDVLREVSLVRHNLCIYQYRYTQ